MILFNWDKVKHWLNVKAHSNTFSWLFDIKCTNEVSFELAFADKKLQVHEGPHHCVDALGNQMK